MTTGYCVECGLVFVDGDDVRERSYGTVHRQCDLTAQAIEATADDALEFAE